MPRPKRCISANSTYYISHHTYVPIFRRAAVVKQFLQTLHSVSELEDFQVFQYIITGERVELLIKMPHPHLAAAMRQLFGMFAQQYRQSNPRSGPVFKNRYQAILIHPDWANGVYQWFENTQQTRRIKYPHKPDLKKLEWLEPLYGTILHIEEITKFFKLKRRPAYLGFDQAPDAPSTDTDQRPTIDAIIQHVAKRFNVSVQQITDSTHKSKTKNIPRSFAMYVCKQVGHYTLKEIADAFNVADPSAVSVRVSRFLKDVKNHPEWLNH